MSPVEHVSHDLDNNLHALRDTISELFSRLTPVLREVDVGEAGADRAKTGIPLVDSMQSQADAVRFSNARLQDLLARLGL